MHGSSKRTRIRRSRKAKTSRPQPRRWASVTKGCCSGSSTSGCDGSLRVSRDRPDEEREHRERQKRREDGEAKRDRQRDADDDADEEHERQDDERHSGLDDEPQDEKRQQQKRERKREQRERQQHQTEEDPKRQRQQVDHIPIYEPARQCVPVPGPLNWSALPRGASGGRYAIGW